MTDNLKTQKKSIEERKRDLEQKKKNLMNKERASSQKRMLEIGRFALKAKINNLDDSLLFGAFIEIANNSNNVEFIAKCRENLQQINTENSGSRITISFKQPPSREIKDHLKSIDFKWNKFRGEYYGFGDKSSLSKIIGKIDCKIEVIE